MKPQQDEPDIDWRDIDWREVLLGSVVLLSGMAGAYLIAAVAAAFVPGALQ